MPASQKTPSTDPAADSPDSSAAGAASADVGQAEVQARSDVETSKGYVGTAVDPIPNEEYALTTGPNSPTALTDNRTRVVQPTVTEETPTDA